jgi:hypothetical protein
MHVFMYCGILVVCQKDVVVALKETDQQEILGISLIAILINFQIIPFLSPQIFHEQSGLWPMPQPFLCYTLRSLTLYLFTLFLFFLSLFGPLPTPFHSLNRMYCTFRGIIE